MDNWVIARRLMQRWRRVIIVRDLRKD